MIVCGFLVQAPVNAATTEVAGVKVNGTAELSGTSLVLNGSGIRYKGPFKVYVAALYLSRKASTPDAVYAATGPKRIALAMLRDMESGPLGRLFMRGMQDNTPPGDLLKVLPALPRMGEIFSEQSNLASGDLITVDWIPGTGTVIAINGKILGQPSKDPEFFQAMLAIWLGKSPADWMLKDALLGVNPSNN